MATQYGNLGTPCEFMQRVEPLIEGIGEEVRLNIQNGVVDGEQAEADLFDLREEATRVLGGACTHICAQQNRCMLESFGPEDPLLKKLGLSEEEQEELLAKRHFDMITLLYERAKGI